MNAKEEQNAQEEQKAQEEQNATGRSEASEPSAEQWFWECAYGHRVVWVERDGERRAFMHAPTVLELAGTENEGWRVVRRARLEGNWFVPHAQVCPSQIYHWSVRERDESEYQA